MPSKSEHYWHDKKTKYPVHRVVPHMSKQDLDPRKFAMQTKYDFLRVPFGGQSYWGFQTEQQAALFEVLGAG